MSAAANAPTDDAAPATPGGPTVSPDGRYAVRTHPWEARMSLWVEPPEIVERSTGRVLLRFADPNWSLAAATWRSASVVVLVLRRFPGDHVPALLEAAVDCERGTACVGAEAGPLALLESALARALAPRRRT